MILPDGYSDIPTGKIAAVVTHLEMTARASRRDDPPGSWSLRKVDTPALAWYRDLFRRVGEEWLWFSRIRMSDAELAAIIHATGIEIYALVIDGREEGLLELDFRQPGQCELVYGTGAARFLMNRALERVWSGEVRRVWVRSCTFDHPSAVAFYQRFGFRQFRRQVEVADDPRLDGTAPRDAAKHVPIIP